MNPDAPATAQPFTYVGFWIRVWASVIDSFLLLLLLVPLGAFVFDTNVLDMSDEPSGPTHFLMSFVLPAMIVLVFWIRRQSTPGKLVFHARIVDAATGAEPRNGQWVVRYLGYYLSAFVLGLGFLWIAFDRRKQGWHDKLANTVVIRTPPGFDADGTADDR